jgi:hypothetical protein
MKATIILGGVVLMVLVPLLTGCSGSKQQGTAVFHTSYVPPQPQDDEMKSYMEKNKGLMKK